MIYHIKNSGDCSIAVSIPTIHGSDATMISAYETMLFGNSTEPNQQHVHIDIRAMPLPAPVPCDEELHPEDFRHDEHDCGDDE